MTPKRRFLPLLLLSLSALLLYSYSHSSLHLFTSHTFISEDSPKNLPSSSFNHLQNPTFFPPKFILAIKVLAFDRLDSLSRCLHSLANADYGEDRVNLHVFVDHFKEIDSGNGSSILNLKLEESQRMLGFVDGFLWRFGEKFVHYRTGNVGLQAQWLESWWPSSDDEFAFVVEDDLEVSPLYYKFLRALIVNYYYNSSNYSPSIYGASLQRPRFVAGKHGNKMHLDSGTRVFLYQLVGTWGQLLFPKPWKEFRLWYDMHKARGIKPILQGMDGTKRWGERIWTPWFIKFIHSRGYFNIYTNFQHERALSISHRDAGVNYGKTAGPDSYILDEKSLDFNLLEMQPLGNLKWYDFCFREVLPERIIGSFDDLGSVLYSVQKQKAIVLVSLFRVSETITKNLLCHFERLDIRNYIMIGSGSDFLLDLARRGHPVINAGQLLNSIRDYKWMHFQVSDMELIKEILVKAYVIKKSLESGFSSWLFDGNMLPVSSDVFSNTSYPPYDISIAENWEILFVKNSPTAVKVWVDDFIHRVESITDSLLSSNTLSKGHRHFGYLVAKSLQEKGVMFKRIDESSFGVKIVASHSNQSSFEGGKKMVFWSSEMGLDLIQSALEDLGLWIIDGDSSCTAVVCHQM